MADGKAGLFHQLRPLPGAAQDLLPEGAGDIGQNAAAIPLAVDLAGAVPHLDQRFDGPLHVAVRSPAALVDVTDDGTGIPFLGDETGRIRIDMFHEDSNGGEYGSR